MGLLIRADASPAIGTGHVMRCLALAQAWAARGGQAAFGFASSTPALAQRIEDEGFAHHAIDAEPGTPADAAATLALAQKLGARHVAADGYHFGAAYQRQVAAGGVRLLLVDDYGHAERYEADLVLNQNIYATTSTYKNRAPGTRLLLGTRYALLRREFWPYRGWTRHAQNAARRILVTFGGSDPANLTPLAVRALASLGVEGLDVAVVAGGSRPRDELVTLTADYPGVRLLRDVRDMPGLMARSDLALSASGSTVWELAFMQVPAIVIPVADNQRPIAAGLDAEGVAVSAGWHRDVTLARLAGLVRALIDGREQRLAMGKRGRALVDGQGAARVAAALAANTPEID